MNKIQLTKKGDTNYEEKDYTIYTGIRTSI